MKFPLALAAASLCLAPSAAAAKKAPLGNGWVSAHGTGYCSVAKWPDVKGPGVIISVARRENLAGWMIFMSPDFGKIDPAEGIAIDLRIDGGQTIKADGAAGKTEDPPEYGVYIDVETILEAAPNGGQITVAPAGRKPATIDATGAKTAFKELRDCSQKLD